jgi:hypothetical protein
VVELDTDRSALVTDRQRLVQAAVGKPQVIERSQSVAGEISKLGVMALGLEFGDHDDREYDLMLGEPGQCSRIGQQDTRVEDVRAPGGGGSGHSFSFGSLPRQTT